MRDIESRIERLEELIGVAGCICGHQCFAFVNVEHGMTEAQQLEREEQAQSCPVHGRLPIIRMYPEDWDL